MATRASKMLASCFCWLLAVVKVLVPARSSAVDLGPVSAAGPGAIFRITEVPINWDESDRRLRAGFGAPKGTAFWMELANAESLVGTATVAAFKTELIRDEPGTPPGAVRLAKALSMSKSRRPI